MIPIGTHPTSRYFIWLAALILLVGFIYALWLFFPSSAEQPATPASVASFPADAPVPTPADYVTAQKGFQYLVSYSDDGFIPSVLTVKKGETHRFTNNSSVSAMLSVD